MVRSTNENYQLVLVSPNGWSPEDPQPSDSRTHSVELLAEAPTLDELQEKELVLLDIRRINFHDEFSYTEIRYPKSYVPTPYNPEDDADIPF